MSVLKIINTLEDMTNKLYKDTVKEYKLTRKDLEIIVNFLTDCRYEFIIENPKKSKLPLDVDNDHIALCPGLIN